MVRKAKGNASSRLDVLEQQAEQARAARRALAQQQLQQASRRLLPEDHEAIRELRDAPQELLEAVNEAMKPYEVRHEGCEVFLAWVDSLDTWADDEPLRPAPVGTVKQLEAWGDMAAEFLKRDGLTELLILGAKWNRADWRWCAELAREAGEEK